jgi:hypothetical protein
MKFLIHAGGVFSIVDELSRYQIRINHFGVVMPFFGRLAGCFPKIIKRFLSLTCLVLIATPQSFGKIAELQVTDGGKAKPIDLTVAHVEAEISDDTAKVTYELSFESNQPRTLEGTFYFALPKDSYVHKFGMWINGSYQSSAIVEAKSGRQAYENIVRRGVDPALLEWTAGNNFKMRVFPITKGNSTKVQIVVGMPARLLGKSIRYDIPLDLGKVKDFSIKVHGYARLAGEPEFDGLKGFSSEGSESDDVRKFTHSLNRSNFLPPALFSIGLPISRKSKVSLRREDGSNERYFSTRIFPTLKSTQRGKADTAVIFWDFSLSEEKSHRDKLAALEQYFKQRRPKYIEVIGFNNKVFPLKTKWDYKKFSAVKKLLSRPYDGGTRMDHLFSKLNSHFKKSKISTDVLLFSNGIDSFEITDFTKIQSLANNYEAFIISPANGANSALLNKIANAWGASVVDQEATSFTGAFVYKPWKIEAISGSKQLRNLVIDHKSILPNDGFVVRGLTKKDGKSSLKVTFSQGERKKAYHYRFDTSEVPVESSGTLGRNWAKVRIQEMLPRKRQYAAEIRELALQHQLMSPYTTMVVLESCEDYVEFKITPPKDCKSRPQSSDEDDYSDYSEGASEESAEIDFGDEADEGSRGDYEEAAAGDYAKDSGSFGGSNVQDSSGGVNFSDVSIGGARKTPLGDLVEPLQPPVESDSSEAREYSDEAEDYDSDYDSDYDGRSAVADKDTPVRFYGFEKSLLAAKKKGVVGFYKKYLSLRPMFEKIPYLYIFSAEQLIQLKQPELAKLVLSNLVETRPGEARWMRIFAYHLIGWGDAQEVLPIYKAIVALREEDPQSYRDYGLALESTNQDLAAYRQFVKVYVGSWDARLRGIKDIVRKDLARVAKKLIASKKVPIAESTSVTKYSKLDHSKDKIVVTASWDTDNTDIDLHVVEPDGTHVYFSNSNPGGTNGRLSLDATQGFGPEQYRNQRPYKGDYRVFLTYYSRDPVVFKDGTFVRVNFKVTENGKTRDINRNFFLKDGREVRTVLTFRYADRSSPVPPPDYKATMSAVRNHLKAKRYTQAKALLNSLGKGSTRTEEASRFFQLARAAAGLKKYGEAERLNQRAFALNNRLYAAIYNNACYSALAKKKDKAIHYLNVLADAVAMSQSNARKYRNLMAKDPDLRSIRGSKSYKDAFQRFELAH